MSFSYHYNNRVTDLESVGRPFKPVDKGNDSIRLQYNLIITITLSSHYFPTLCESGTDFSPEDLIFRPLSVQHFNIIKYISSSLVRVNGAGGERIGRGWIAWAI
jgi:hypothetical protein